MSVIGGILVDHSEVEIVLYHAHFICSLEAHFVKYIAARNALLYVCHVITIIIRFVLLALCSTVADDSNRRVFISAMSKSLSAKQDQPKDDDNRFFFCLLTKT